MDVHVNLGPFELTAGVNEDRMPHDASLKEVGYVFILFTGLKNKQNVSTLWYTKV